MDKVTFSIPAMWADHHALAVREALGQLEGVQDVIASPAYKDVLIKYEAGTVTPKALEDALAAAGYATGQAPELPAHPENIDDASAWYQIQERVTETDIRDLQMSGDHRMY
jgi:copper chaperone CopZ